LFVFSLEAVGCLLEGGFYWGINSGEW